MRYYSCSPQARASSLSGVDGGRSIDRLFFCVVAGGLEILSSTELLYLVLGVRVSFVESIYFHGDALDYTHRGQINIIPGFPSRRLFVLNRRLLE